MTVSNLSFSANLPPFSQTTGYATNFSKNNIALAGNLGITKTTDPHTGHDTSTVTSALRSNGISFISTGSSQNGDLLTVNYVSDQAANSGTNSAISKDLLKTFIQGSGVQFAAHGSTTHDGTAQVSYDTQPNKAYAARVQSAAVSSETGNSAQNILLKSYSQVGNTISITFQVSNGALTNNTELAHVQVPLENPSYGGINSSSGAGAGTGPTFDNNIGYKTIGDVLASANGLTAALHPVAVDHSTQSQQSVAALVNSANVLSGSPTGGTSVSDFIDTALNAFPTSAPGKAADAYNATNDFLNTKNDNNNLQSTRPAAGNTSHTSSTGSSFDSSSSNNSYSNSPAPTAISSSISNANASTIRGVGVNTFA